MKNNIKTWQLNTHEVAEFTIIRAYILCEWHCSLARAVAMLETPCPFFPPRLVCWIRLPTIALLVSKRGEKVVPSSNYKYGCLSTLSILNLYSCYNMPEAPRLCWSLHLRNALKELLGIDLYYRTKRDWWVPDVDSTQQKGCAAVQGQINVQHISNWATSHCTLSNVSDLRFCHSCACAFPDSMLSPIHRSFCVSNFALIQGIAVQEVECYTSECASLLTDNCIVALAPWSCNSICSITLPNSNIYQKDLEFTRSLSLARSLSGTCCHQHSSA